MNHQRGFTVLVLAFVVVLLGGAAIAGVGALSTDTATPGGPVPQPSEDAAEPDSALSPSSDETPDGSDTASSSKIVIVHEPLTAAASLPETESASKADSEAEAAAEADDAVKDREADRRLELTILSPENGARVEEPVIAVKGRTHPGATVAHGRQTVEAGDDGRWVMRVELEPGENRLKFVAELGDQRTAAGLVVTYHRTVDKRFTAHQRWEASDGNPATNVYYGTGVAGTKITVRSAHGGGSTEVDGRGNWELKVRFPDAPCNEWFKVRVAAATGQSKDFRMKRICRTDTRFTAHQRWEVVDGDPVVNHYYGTAQPGAEVWVGSEFGAGHTRTNDDGKWELRVEFPEAPCNEPFRVAAESGDARVEFKMKRVCEVDHTFTANQKYGSCGEDIPYDVFWGTGIPGTTITVRSEFGGGTTTVGDRGKWEIKVEFPSAPAGETFKVLLTDGHGGEAVFEFTNTGGGGDH